MSARPTHTDGPSIPLVAIGASAGGLEACSALLRVLPGDMPAAFVLVLHLDPSHDSMMVDLLARDTGLTVVLAADGMALRPAHLHVIPPGVFLTVAGGVLRTTAPERGKAVRLPFDVLLRSLARTAPARLGCVVLSGSGMDGSGGLPALRAAGALIVAQDPQEAGHAGMPDSAIATGCVDHVLRVAGMPAVLGRLVAGSRPAVPDRRPRAAGAAAGAGAGARAGTRADAGAGAGTGADAGASGGAFDAIIALVAAAAPQDVALYKSGTIRRRIARRMALAGCGAAETGRYLAMLRADGAELARLSADLLIHVTGFFRDPAVFDHLAATGLPALIAAQPADRPLRVWVAGCSTGEEAYSLAMLCIEALEAAGSRAGLQVFASDIDAAAIATAREGLYPAEIAPAVSPDRLARFFEAEGAGWRVRPALRDVIVFTVADLLSDPPFSRIDLLSCRNLLIYLEREAQRRVAGLCAFALRQGGLLLLGAAETPGPADGRFALADKGARLWRRVGPGRPGDLHVATGARPGRPAEAPAQPGRRATLAELCRRIVLENHAPAAVLLNRRLECLYLLGPTERYLSIAPGHPGPGILGMLPRALHARFRAAAASCDGDSPVVVVPGGRSARAGRFDIELRAVAAGSEPLLLACFVAVPAPAALPDADRAPEEADRALPDADRTLPDADRAQGDADRALPDADRAQGDADRALPDADRAQEDADRAQGDAARIVALEAELAATRTDLAEALRDLERAAEDHAADTAEALSVNEEFQSTNEELLASKEELQALNEELTALNAQLQETVERHRSTANDLQNVLYSTDVATIFLDRDLDIRFFTPSARAVFHVIASDIGRPLADLAALARDDRLGADAAAVVASAAPIAREVEGAGGIWYQRRVQPYRTDGGRIEGVVITFVDITDRKRTHAALVAARREADRATVAKSRFLAAASHDLRQPLQSLALLHALLTRDRRGSEARRLSALLARTLGSMTEMLDSLLDANRIESGIVRPEMRSVPVAPLLARLAEEFAPMCAAKGLKLRVVHSAAWGRTDPQLLQQILRNLLSNALKYTDAGGILMGCRIRGGQLTIQVSDSGIGIAQAERKAIFEAYHQVGKPGHPAAQGLGLGLSIVQRLARLLDHPVAVRSTPGRGSSFAVTLPLVAALAAEGAGPAPSVPAAAAAQTGTVLLVEDEDALRGLLAEVLTGAGHAVIALSDGHAALAWAAGAERPPDLLLTDFDLHGIASGLSLAHDLAKVLGAAVPTIILTGDITAATLKAIAATPFAQVAKPVAPAKLLARISALLRGTRAARARGPGGTPPATLHVVDDDPTIREATRRLFEAEGWRVVTYPSAEAFLAAHRPEAGGCLLVDGLLPGMSGVALLEALRAERSDLPAVMLTGHGDVAMAVSAMQAGAADLLEKPASASELLASVGNAAARATDARARTTAQKVAQRAFAGLTPRERDVLDKVLDGAPNKIIAADLAINQRTVENHRAAVMRKTGAASLPDLVRMALAAGLPSA